MASRTSASSGCRKFAERGEVSRREAPGGHEDAPQFLVLHELASHEAEGVDVVPAGSVAVPGQRDRGSEDFG